MKITEVKDGIIIEDIMDFDAEHIFECGQCFRWSRQADNSYTGVAYGRVLNVKSEPQEGRVLLKNTNIEDFNNIWFEYFDLGRDYGDIKRKLREDPVLDMAINHGEGLRILNQEPWEMLISFITSANNNIPRITGSLNMLSELYGSPIEYEGRRYYAFPTPEELSSCSVEDILQCRAGFRCRYIYEAVRMVETGEISLGYVKSLELGEARQELMRVPGVGPKVADCIMLFSMQKYASYPVDVWVKRVTEYFYLGRDVKLKEIQSFARDKFGSLAGFAQEYLFYYARDLKLSTK